MDEATDRTHDTIDEPARRCLTLRGILPNDNTWRALTGRAIVIGRGADCDVRIEAAKTSRRHAELYVQGCCVALRDLGSTNGTYVDGQRVDHSALRAGSLLRVGDWLGLVHEESAREGPNAFGELAPGIWGGSSLTPAVRTLQRVAPSELSVLLVGETGSGKERFARALHERSSRSGSFHAINCAALPVALAEAELFGYQKGAFTGADRNHRGHLRMAHRGTLFMDEVAELSLPIQAKLLRALELREVMPLGASEAQSFNTRLIAASQISLEELVRAGKFREDLLARLGGLALRIPPLRERVADIPSTFKRFLSTHWPGTIPAVSTRCYEALCLHSWPGNVRELDVLTRHVSALFGNEPVLRRSHLPDGVATKLIDVNGASGPFKTRNEQDLTRLRHALASAPGNLKKAAEAAGISRQRAYRLIQAQSGQSTSGAAVMATSNDDLVVE